MTPSPETLFITAHPDDAETMLGYAISANPRTSHVLVATDGDASTIHRTGEAFVRQGGRRLESIAGLTALGVDQTRQEYLNIPDGSLTYKQSEIAEHIAQLALARDITRIVTLGDDGYDGHPDHIATHMAAAWAVKQMLDTANQPIQLFALDSRQQGRYTVLANGRQQHKLRAMASHASQFDIKFSENSFTPGIEFWLGFLPYHQVVEIGETYDIR
jgi:LmbE family N-acetylglucosaminyl deacetylase